MMNGRGVIGPAVGRVMLACVTGLLIGAGVPAGCHKKASDHAQLDGQAAKQSLANLRSQFGELRKRFGDLGRRAASMSPDVPGFPEARARFYAAEEARGVAEARLDWLSSRLDAALSAGKRDELQEVSKEIAASSDDVRRIDEFHTKMLHEMMAFQRVARERSTGPVTATPAERASHKPNP
jgi:hypothetical protein